MKIGTSTQIVKSCTTHEQAIAFCRKQKWEVFCIAPVIARNYWIVCCEVVMDQRTN